MSGCRISNEYTRRGIETVFLENDSLRVEVLAGKGGDVTVIRDKRTDTNVLFESPHRWRAPAEGYVGAPDGTFSYMDHYPGGWQDVLPAAGGPATVAGAPLALHGESPLVPWEATIVSDSSTKVTVELSVSLTRYPFDVERTLTLRADDSTLYVDESITNRGEVETPYSWLQHLAFGPPFISPDAELEIPCETILTDPDLGQNAQVPAGERFEWPTVDTGDSTVDLREFPPKNDRVHDLSALTGLEGRYTIRNPELDLGVTVRFPEHLFEYVWFWRAFGGFEEAPYFGRNYTAGLEPCTSIPNAGLERAIENGTANRLGPGGNVGASIEVALHPADS